MVKGLNYELGKVGTNDIADGTVLAADVGSYAILTKHISGAQVTSTHLLESKAGTGSPLAYGNSFQFGTATLGAGSNVWVVFGTPFKAAPVVVATYMDGNVASVIAGSPVGAGSVLLTGVTASKLASWIAVGSSY